MAWYFAGIIYLAKKREERRRKVKKRRSEGGREDEEKEEEGKWLLYSITYHWKCFGPGRGVMGQGESTQISVKTL